MREPYGIAFMGDVHGNTRWIQHMIEKVAKNHGDTILQLGDYGYTYVDSFVNGVESACAEHDIMLYFVDGNHDDHSYLWSLPLDEDGLGILSEHVRYIPRGYRWTWWGLTFMGLGGATSVDKAYRKPFTEWWPTEAITAGDVYKATELGHVDVIIAHDCPSGVPIPGITFKNGLLNFPAEALHIADAHRDVLRGVVDAVTPKLYVHGHYHRPYRYLEESTGTIYQGLDMDGTNENLWFVLDEEDLFK